MAKIRFGYSDDFTAKNNKVGINTTEPQANLDVVDGAVKGHDLKVTGVSSLTAYEGFLRADHQIEEETQLNFGQGINASLSGEIIVGTGQTVTVNEVVKETAGVGNNGNLIWKNIAGNHGDGKLSSGLVSNWDGKAFHFDNNDHVELPMSLGYTTKVSAFAWFKHGGTPAGGYHIIFGGQELEISIPSAGQLRTGLLGDQRYVENYGSTGQLTDGSWHYIGFTYDGTTKTSYIDGVLVGTQTVSGTLDHTFGNRTIGRFGTSTQYYLNGYLSAAQIYDRDLTVSEILSNYNLGPYYKEAAVTNGLVLHLNASNPSSYPGTLSDVDTTDINIAGGSEIECLKVFNTFTPPSGGTNERPYKPKPGQLYYNYDLKTIEFHDGNGWRQVDNTTRSGRGVMCGGSPGEQEMEYVQIQTTGNAQYFGDLVNSGHFIHGCCGSETRGINGGGYDTGETNNSQSAIDYFTIASAGNSIDFGTLDAQHFRNCAACSSSTRGLFFGGGHPSYYNTIEYIEIGTLGNALDFGDQVTSAAVKSSFSSSTRGFSFGGFPAYSPALSVVTIAAKGNATKFGELTSNGLAYGGCANGVKGIFAGGYTQGAQLMKSINYITMASEGNAQYFGDLTIGRNYPGGMATQTRAVFCGGLIESPTISTNLIDYVNIASSGDAVDFGDMTISSQRRRGTSDSHGGLGGF